MKQYFREIYDNQNIHYNLATKIKIYRVIIRYLVRVFGLSISEVLISFIYKIQPLKKSGAYINTPTDEYRFDLVISTIPLPLVGEIFSKSNINYLITNSYKKLSKGKK